MTKPSLVADPPPAALAWVEQVVGAGVHQWLALPGATTAAVHRITLDGGPDVVLKHFIWPEFLDGHPDAAEREAWALDRVADVVPAPEVLGVDPDGRQAGAPALLSSFCEGDHSLDIAPEALAEAAADIATVSIDADPSPAWRYEPYFTGSELFVPAWAGRPGDWESLIDAATSLDVGGNWFIHRDYHPWNVLSDAGHITGIVDWMSAGPGPWQIDVSHCRLNLVLLGRPEAADAYLAAYERLSGRRYDPRWDALNIVDALPFYGPRNHVDEWGGYSVLTTTERDAHEQRMRIDAFARHTAARLDESRV